MQSKEKEKLAGYREKLNATNERIKALKAQVD